MGEFCVPGTSLDSGLGIPVLTSALDLRLYDLGHHFASLGTELGDVRGTSIPPPAPISDPWEAGRLLSPLNTEEAALWPAVLDRCSQCLGLSAVPRLRLTRAADMYEQEGSWDVSFAGSGFLGLYHVGVLACLKERAPQLLSGARRFYGSSSGSLCCLAVLTSKSMDFCCSNLMDILKEVQAKSIGIFHPSYDILDFVKRRLQKHLPDNVHELASQRMGVSLTRWPDGKNVIITHFATRDELIQAVLCSIYFPFYCGVIPPEFRGERYVDGALSNNLPFTDSKSTITISPFHGTVDICPQSSSASFHELNLCNASFQMCTKNFHFGILSLIPPEPEVVADVCRQGYLDALRFLERRGLTKEGVIPTLLCGVMPSSSSVIWPVSSNQGGNVGSEEEGKSEGLHINLRVHNVLVRDIAKFELLSPELEAALQKSCEKPNGFFARFSRSIPGQVLTYALLPCTLPLEYVYFKTKRLISWIPDAPEDIQWMHRELKKFGGFVLAEVKDRLLGSSGEPRGDSKPSFFHLELKDQAIEPST
ncbi:patatin-like phospholipase domain-containing protein 5 [Petaurus breviceps papuanus]|uniref:patatin-like phospholipase domain-containing protein 5 n=1 Tax=Petaurus breviceps papuanus TaxID=3040969 RepID=UPI0036DE5611